MIKSAVPALLFLVVLLHLQTELVQSACCRSNWANKRCGDGTIGTPCCGYRKCNFFCCACECRKSKRSVRDVSSNVTEEHQHEEDPFLTYDEDKDGKISIPEAQRWIMTGGCGNPIVNIVRLTSHFGKLDSDNDGWLDRMEIGG